METISLVAALVLAGAFAWAALAKFADSEAVETGFSALGLPQPRLLSWLVPVCELGVAALLVTIRPLGAILAFAALMGFTVFLIQLVQSGHPAPCNCFGAKLSKPVNQLDILRNLVLLALAALAL